MKTETPLYPSLVPTSWARFLFAALALALTGVLFALLPVADAINRKAAPVRLAAAPAAAAPQHTVRKRVEFDEAPSGAKTSAVTQPRAPSSPFRRPAPPLKLPSHRLPNLSHALPLTTLLPGVGDVSLAFAVSTPAAEGEAAPAAPLRPFTVRDLDEPPRLLITLRPLYPLLAKQRGIEGHVDIEFLIAKDGAVGTVTVLHADPPEVFNDAACKTAKHWRFSVPQKNGVAVDVLARQRIQFRLEK